MARGQDQNDGVWINLTGKESFALSIRDGRIVAANKVSGGTLKKKPDIKVEAKPLSQYPGDTLDEKIRAELRDVIARQEQVVKDNPHAKLIHVYVSPQTFRKIVGIINEHQHEGALAQANALNDFVKSPRDRPRDNDRSERDENGGERSRPNERRESSESNSRERGQANDNNEREVANDRNERRGGRGDEGHYEREPLGELSSRNNSERDLSRSERQPLPDRSPAGAVVRSR